MMLEIIRIEECKDGTFGVLKLNGECFCVTLELPYKCNQEDISSIPRGTYKVRRSKSPNFGMCYKVVDVPGRTDIICGHVGNTIDDTDGCMLFARRFGVLDGRRAILNSATVIDHFMERMGDIYETDLLIRECYA